LAFCSLPLLLLLWLLLLVLLYVHRVRTPLGFRLLKLQHTLLLGPLLLLMRPLLLLLPLVLIGRRLCWGWVAE
jgi:hypothetical protein